MMRNILAFSIFWLFFGLVQAGEWIPISSPKESPSEVVLVSGLENQSVVKFTLKGFERIRVSTPEGDAFRISVPGGTYLLEAGSPDLPKLTASLMIPAGDEMAVRILSSKYMDFHGIKIAPSKGNLTRDINPSDIPYTYGKVYDQAGFYPGQMTSLREPYILRDVRGQTLVTYPFHYEASTQTLRVYFEMVVEVYSTGNPGYNTLPASPVAQIDHEFQQIYQRHFLNYQASKYTPLADHGKMLIISHGAYMQAMQPFVAWKNMSGIPTQMVDVATVGVTSAAIKAYVQNYYNTNGLTFLLLVGDAMHIPTMMTSSGHSDNSYGYLVGSDSYPEVFVGRFSAESVADVETQVLRTLMYERDLSPQFVHFNRGVGIASNEGPGDDNEMDYQHVRNMLNDLTGYTYSYTAELYEGTQGGFDQPGNPTAAMVTSELNNGAGNILYTGHGSTTSWGTTGFSNNNINALTNGGVLPFIWAVACVNGNFVNNTCFAEAWMRARSGDLPTGAVATLMSTINQSWDPPMEGQDEMVDILVESYASNIKRTFGGLSMNGCMKMNDSYGSGGSEMTDTWNLFGDPSLMVRTDTPQYFAATHLPTLLLGTSQMNITTSLAEGLATLSHNGQIIARQSLVSGNVNLTYSPLIALDTLTLVITSYNKIPYITYIPVIPATGPYVLYCQHQVADPQGNQNGLPDYGETVYLNIALQNLGIAQANVVSASLQTSSPYVTLTNTVNSWGNIPAGDTNMLLSAFLMHIDSIVPDQHTVVFDLSVADTSGNSWSSTFTMKINAPVLEFGKIVLDDVAGGNGNGLVDPGETILVSIPALNNGHSHSLAASLLLASASPFVTIDTSLVLLSSIPLAGQQWGHFTIHIDSSIALGSSIDLHAFLNSGGYQAQFTYHLPVGIVGEDFETGDFSKFPWTFGGTSNWIIESANPYQGSFSAKSGAIGSNTSTELIINMDVLINDTISFYRKVSSEYGYDFLEFYIDNTKMDQWSGEEAWSRKSYPVSAGNRTFKWKYVKDWYMTAGSDRAWVDEIIFPPVAAGTSPLAVNVLALPDVICEGESSQLLAVVSTSGGNITYTWSPSSGLSDASLYNPMASPSTTTTYFVTVTDGSASAMDSVRVEVLPRPITPVVSAFGPDLTSSAPSDNQWYDSLGAIPGATGQVFTPAMSGSYYVVVTGTNGCISLPSNIISFTWTGIPAQQKQVGMQIWPNPASTFAHVSYTLQNPSQVSIQLMDLLGNIVGTLYEGTEAPGKVSRRLELNDLPKGLYLIAFRSDEWQGMQKLVIR